MKIKYNLFILLFVFFGISKVMGDTIFFDSKNIQIENEGNMIYSKNSIAEIPDQKITIQSNEAIYDKVKSELIVIGNVKFFDNINNVYIESEKAIYNQIEDIILTKGDTSIYFENKYEMNSEDVLYDRKSNLILSELFTKVFDDIDNIYLFKKGFIFDLIKEVISSDTTNIIDNENNSYTFDDVKINLNSNELVGKEVKVEFVDNFFGIEDNDPLLKGKSAISDESKTIIQKAVFSTCNTKIRKCRGWELQSDEFTHNKTEQLFEYRNSWLKILNQRVFFMPYFNHPDPSVKRKSGFLTPVYSNSDSLGRSINIPYFYVLSDAEDMTFNPRIYSDNDFIIQTEYRQVFENSNIIADFSFNQDENNTNTHAIFSLNGQLDETTSYSFEFQNTSNDNYLKIHDFQNVSETNPLVSRINPSLQTSFFKFEKQIDDDTNLSSSMRIYEDTTVTKESDRYQYIFPDFSFRKRIDLDDNYDGFFDFGSSGHQKHYDTNVYEAQVNNNFNFRSFDYFSDSGLLSNYDLTLINLNTYAKNSLALEKNNNHNLLGSMSFGTSYPLKKKFSNSTNYLKPKAQFKFSPTNTGDSSGDSIRLNYDNLFSSNRIRSAEVEEGRSLTIGLEFEKQNLINEKIMSLNIGSVIKDKKNSSMPSSSKLDQTRTDIVGNFAYHLNKNIQFEYDFSYDRDLDFSNYDAITAKLGNNKIVTSFGYVTENHELGNSETISNNTDIYFNDDHSLKFKTTKNLIADFTQYYELAYKYETDCLLATLQYNKKFFRDGNLIPDESLYFLIKFIPFTSLRGSANTIFEN